jgi:hypothetical protein
MTTIAELISQSRTAAADEPTWLGSSEHLQLLTESLSDLGVADVALVWVPAGQAAYWEAATRRIMLERPRDMPPVSAEDRAEYTALGLLHECLHARYSTPSSLGRQLRAVEPRLRPTTGAVFNYLEDARVAKLAIADEPELADPIASHLNAAVDQLDELSGAYGSGTSPPDPSNQLAFAIMAYALTPDRSVALHPAVVTELDTLRPIIDAARDGERTEVCVRPAIGAHRAND